MKVKAAFKVSNLRVTQNSPAVSGTELWAHPNKVCGLSSGTGSWVQQRHITAEFFKRALLFVLFVRHWRVNSASSQGGGKERSISDLGASLCQGFMVGSTASTNNVLGQIGNKKRGGLTSGAETTQPHNRLAHRNKQECKRCVVCHRYSKHSVHNTTNSFWDWSGTQWSTSLRQGPTVTVAWKHLDCLFTRICPQWDGFLLGPSSVLPSTSVLIRLVLKDQAQLPTEGQKTSPSWAETRVSTTQY